MTEPKQPKMKRVGDGITGYEREENVYDPEHHKRALRGELIHRDLIAKPERDLLELRGKLAEMCRIEFQENGLPDPFTLIHMDGSDPPIDWGIAVSLGDDYVKSKHDQGYVLSALFHLPPEDHSKLWYAAKIAFEFAKLDSLINSSRNTSQMITDAAEIGVEIGRLENELRMKLAHEKDVLTRQKQRLTLGQKNEGRDEYNANRQTNAIAWRAHAEEILSTLDAGKKNSDKAKSITVRWNDFGDDESRPTPPSVKTIKNWLSEK